jgi:hypothetical protein
MIEPQIVFDPASVALPRRRREIHRPPGRVELVEELHDELHSHKSVHTCINIAQTLRPPPLFS